ncbi:MAG TPA: hydrogenase maturation nickel metallochaperone HypA [Bryobacteraceae bacterium]|nr:hydrogenase maturation nickel metallochaperone HypA [Bryobacteraceae bacterium]
MHELSIALSIIEGVEEEMERRGTSRVAAVHLKIGPLSGVSKDALLFSYEIAREGTLLEGARLEIEETPVLLYCEVCRDQVPAVSMQRLYCAICDNPSADIRQGSEMEVVALELMDEYSAEAG